MIDATVVGSGPNGLTAALVLARAGLSVRVVERADAIGGGLRTAELTLPGFRHDVCSAVHPAALASPAFRELGVLDDLPMVVPEASFAHPLDDGPAAVSYRDLQRTADELEGGGRGWKRLFEPLVRSLPGVVDFTGTQLLRVPRDPIAAVRYGIRALRQGTRLTTLRTLQARALFAGVAAHAIGRQPSLATAGTGLLLGAHAHGAGWPVPIGGSQAIAHRLAELLRQAGGIIETGTEIRTPADLEPSRITLLDTSVEFLERFAGDRLPAGYLRALHRYRHGAAVSKVDFALSAPVPWRDARVGAAPTVHLGGTAAEIAAAEADVAVGRMPPRPYVLVVQPSVVDPSRAPAGAATLWAYTHVPAGSDLDATEVITAQVERFAPGFRDVILGSTATTPTRLERNNPNDVGGDILGGAVTLGQLVKRPVVSRTPWRTPVPGLYLCSSSTPPGPAVHGMCGWHAARLALRDMFGR